MGQAFALSVGSSDPNNDTLTTTWDFGDGAHGTGASTSHTYATTGIHHVVATVSDGNAQTTATTDITVTQPSGGGSGLTGSGPVRATSFGAMFTLIATRACFRPGTTFTAALVVKRIKGKKYLIATIRRAVFSTGGKTTKTDRSAPYRVSLTLPAATLAGAVDKVTARAYLKLRNGARATKTLKLAVRACG